jgi:7-carboxy-7-deazaguanine synthase
MMANPTARSIPISEIFGPTIQGEGALIGRPTVFVRTGGCDFRCNWCDTLYAVLPEYKNEWTPLSPEQIVARVLELSRGAGILVTLSGGNPALHDFSELLELGRSKNLSFALETQGSVARDRLNDL